MAMEKWETSVWIVARTHIGVLARPLDDETRMSSPHLVCALQAIVRNYLSPTRMCVSQAIDIDR